MNALYAVVATEPATDFDKGFVDVYAAKRAQQVIVRLQQKTLQPLTAPYVVQYLGRQAFSCDASGSQRSGGWGICVEGKVAHGLWQETIRQALSEDIISISLL